MALKSIPLDSCKKARNGRLIMKSLSKEYKQEAGAAIKGCFKQDPQFLVYEPWKLKPNMTVVGIRV